MTCQKYNYMKQSMISHLFHNIETYIKNQYNTEYISYLPYKTFEMK